MVGDSCLCPDLSELGRMENRDKVAQSSGKHIARAERRARVIALRRDQKFTLRQIAAREGCGVETVRRDINRYMAALDAACLEGAAAMRAEEYERLDKMASQLETAIDNGDLSQVPAALKTSESIRRLYALDVQPLGRTELALRRAVITEVASRLRDELPPETFAEIAVLLTDDEPIHFLDGVAVAAADEEGAPPPRCNRSRQSDPQSAGQQAPEQGGGGVGSGIAPLPVVVSD
jgi:hypothetical protein